MPDIIFIQSKTSKLHLYTYITLENQLYLLPLTYCIPTSSRECPTYITYDSRLPSQTLIAYNLYHQRSIIPQFKAHLVRMAALRLANCQTLTNQCEFDNKLAATAVK